jgi:hypothetical protein
MNPYLMDICRDISQIADLNRINFICYRIIFSNRFLIIKNYSDFKACYHMADSICVYKIQFGTI